MIENNQAVTKSQLSHLCIIYVNFLIQISDTRLGKYTQNRNRTR